jgi:peptidyl-prolyl cis-trans isomerase B (cyclophilin B)
VNKFYFAIAMIIIGIFLGIFYITQKDTLIKDMFNSPTPVIPPESSSLQFTVLTPAQEKTMLNQTPQNKQGAAPTFGVEEGVKASYSATISTSKGDIRLTIFGQDAPRTVKNFISKVKSGFYKNLTFHRVEDWVIQGGDPKGDGTGGGLMQTEINQRPFETGSLGVARGGDIRVSNDSQFFITKSEASWLNQQYTNFGIVTEGMDVVNKIGIGDKILGIKVE